MEQTWRCNTINGQSSTTGIAETLCSYTPPPSLYQPRQPSIPSSMSCSRRGPSLQSTPTPSTYTGTPATPPYTSYDNSPTSTRNNSTIGTTPDVVQELFHIREPQRRCTTITLREIKYPYGCPCHPEPTSDNPRRKSSLPHFQSANELYRVSSWDRDSNRWRPHARPELTRRADSETSTGSQNSDTGSANSNTSSTPSRPRALRSLSRLWNRIGN